MNPGAETECLEPLRGFSETTQDLAARTWGQNGFKVSGLKLPGIESYEAKVKPHCCSVNLPNPLLFTCIS